MLISDLFIQKIHRVGNQTYRLMLMSLEQLLLYPQMVDAANKMLTNGFRDLRDMERVVATESNLAENRYAAWLLILEGNEIVFLACIALMANSPMSDGENAYLKAISTLTVSSIISETPGSGFGTKIGIPMIRDWALPEYRHALIDAFKTDPDANFREMPQQDDEYFVEYGIKVTSELLLEALKITPRLVVSFVRESLRKKWVGLFKPTQPDPDSPRLELYKPMSAGDYAAEDPRARIAVGYDPKYGSVLQMSLNHFQPVHPARRKRVVIVSSTASVDKLVEILNRIGVMVGVVPEKVPGWESWSAVNDFNPEMLWALMDAFGPAAGAPKDYYFMASTAGEIRQLLESLPGKKVIWNVASYYVGYDMQP